MYTVLEHNNFNYDCTWPTRTFGYVDAEQGLYPYTLDYKSVQDCQIPPCPKCSHPGLWVQPIIDLEDEGIGMNPNTPDYGNPCSMLDACLVKEHNNWTQPEDPNQVYHMLMKNFKRVYEGDKKFIQEIASYPDVWIVPVQAGIDYMQDLFFDSNFSNEQLIELGKDKGPFACADIENQTG